MPAKTKAAKSRRRRTTPVQAFKLSAGERILLVLYHTAPVAVRADVAQRLFRAWMHPDPGVVHATEDRWNVAKDRFQIGSLTLGVLGLDAVQAGEALEMTGGAS